jgi:hypothetical protein
MSTEPFRRRDRHPISIDMVRCAARASHHAQGGGGGTAARAPIISERHLMRAGMRGVHRQCGAVTAVGLAEPLGAPLVFNCQLSLAKISFIMIYTIHYRDFMN